ncbi:MAG: hypothetical protein AVDCRST_MAG11-800, partial [uncultured Gemmatimonadaceae bacterium]
PAPRPLLSATLRLALAVAGAVAVVALAAYALWANPAEAGRARATAQSLLVSALDPGERVEHQAYAYQRYWWDYFRETHGVLALTDRRILFVGIPPRNVLVPDDGPPASERREFPLDTLTRVARTRVFAGAAPGVLFSARGAAEAFGLPTESRAAADTIVRVLERRQAVSRASASRDRRAQEYAAWLARLPIWHRVERGEALSTLATRYNTTVEQLRALNGLPDDRVRIGQRLIVKPQT